MPYSPKIFSYSTWAMYIISRGMFGTFLSLYCSGTCRGADFDAEGAPSLQIWCSRKERCTSAQWILGRIRSCRGASSSRNKLDKGRAWAPYTLTFSSTKMHLYALDPG
ncbi:hypothetical protein IW262DRAFT_1419992 [Armillaria fumosa]|nr:hypothetical protein IW262DRAFT_1419992 [Armillaria fumosa]